MFLRCVITNALDSTEGILGVGGGAEEKKKLNQMLKNKSHNNGNGFNATEIYILKG